MLIALPDASATTAFGAALAKCMQAPLLVFLHGELGAGKTTLVRGVLQAMGYEGAVKSPTYSLLERYELPTKQLLYHLDLYRLKGAVEFEYLGMDEAFSLTALVLIEWPELARASLPRADLELHCRYQGLGRMLEIQAGTTAGRSLIQCLTDFRFT